MCIESCYNIGSFYFKSYICSNSIKRKSIIVKLTKVKWQSFLFNTFMFAASLGRRFLNVFVGLIIWAATSGFTFFFSLKYLFGLKTKRSSWWLSAKLQYRKCIIKGDAIHRLALSHWSKIRICTESLSRKVTDHCNELLMLGGRAGKKRFFFLSQFETSPKGYTCSEDIFKCIFEKQYCIWIQIPWEFV